MKSVGNTYRARTAYKLTTLTDSQLNEMYNSAGSTREARELKNLIAIEAGKRVERRGILERAARLPGAVTSEDMSLWDRQLTAYRYATDKQRWPNYRQSK
jgi:hypothetical protein